MVKKLGHTSVLDKPWIRLNTIAHLSFWFRSANGKSLKMSVMTQKHVALYLELS